ncbi:hypothetical protein [Natranaerobius trueperi]|uniref:Uncharacterized protein n=1 Tax=Natranaerobius trueperi TaxID=759412 RepID=A0A226BZB0_9FIRM|nr:hypothetical protein [Natranaerobius trueperi]OWZ84388.1 hypothetical protein CDO51_03755 [Natranaerobius trueperi]
MFRKVVVLTMVLMLAGFGTVLAQGDVSPPPGEIAKDGYAEDEVVVEKGRISPDLANLLYRYVSSIEDVGNGKVEIEGTTQTHSSVESLTVEVTLQRWTGSEWTDVTSVRTSDNNERIATTSKTESVEPGYYRAIGTHNAFDGHLRQTETTQTSSIIVE